MTPDFEREFARITRTYSPGSLDRVEQMLAQTSKRGRHPLQDGARWILPGISQQPWHDPYGHPELLPVVKALEEHQPAIKRELTRLRSAHREELYLFRGGALVAPSARLAPTAFEVVKQSAVDSGVLCPLLESRFSTLLPGAVIKPHCDLWNFSIGLHLAIDIPEHCSITVAGETRSWIEGECLLFDYSFEHEAANHGDRPRICLLVDLWHPETTLAEREALTVLISEIRAMLGE
ncbi:hypothetical protein P3T36_000389 [Kitasatospora sp. MAP12-15]|uniref:aspartyl/asparaginyl beta-hydroxylase domain-containing protein n=1 Tax=unclassified Kitasatospora TaxID=2633591 RepID=UPI002476E187|nr:aspartyl/asparaginyl beta-hydroxylase domain-containing protein [Kitasatospora sp. MAP12-44]MDH6109618.1 hypothetical protein [Kitasatospora sp. MAP12-44]